MMTATISWTCLLCLLVVSLSREVPATSIPSLQVPQISTDLLKHCHRYLGTQSTESNNKVFLFQSKPFCKHLSEQFFQHFLTRLTKNSLLAENKNVLGVRTESVEPAIGKFTPRGNRGSTEPSAEYSKNVKNILFRPKSHVRRAVLFQRRFDSSLSEATQSDVGDYMSFFPPRNRQQGPVIYSKDPASLKVPVGRLGKSVSELGKEAGTSAGCEDTELWSQGKPPTKRKSPPWLNLKSSSLTKRRLSINNALMALTDMVMEHGRDRMMRNRDNLRYHMLLQG